MNSILINSSGSDTSPYMPVEEEISPKEDHRTQQLQLCSVYNSSYNHHSSFNYPPIQHNLDLSYPQVSSNNQLLPPLNYALQYHAQPPLAPNDEYSNQFGLEPAGHRLFYPSTESSWALAQFFKSGGCYYGFGNQPPQCQAEGCKANLTSAKRYHRRHKVCEFHSKASVVHLGGGIMQRFCQQCSRFHMLDEFDESKKSCRRRLADHNRRRRKAKPDSPQPNSGSSFATPTNITQANNSSLEQQTTAPRQTNAAIAREQEVPKSKGKVMNPRIQANLIPQREYWLHASIRSSISLSGHAYHESTAGPSSGT